MSRLIGIGSMTGISTFRNVVVVEDFIPNSVNWANITHAGSASCGTPYGGNPPQQITGISSTINIRVSAHFIGTVPPSNPQSTTIYYRKSASSFSQMTGGCSATGIASSPDFGQYTALTTYTVANPSSGIIEVSNGDYLAFAASYSTGDPLSDEPVTIWVANLSSSSAKLDEFLVSLTVSSCFLTTAMVGYFGLADDGAELTAMRSLRSHFSQVEGYPEIIQEYYANSQSIINAIEAEGNEDGEYSYIRSTVLAVKGHVDLGEWQQAHDLYMAMYTDLKARYLGT